MKIINFINLRHEKVEKSSYSDNRYQYKNLESLKILFKIVQNVYKASRYLVTPYMRMGGGERGGGIYPLLRVQKNVTGRQFLED